MDIESEIAFLSLIKYDVDERIYTLTERKAEIDKAKQFAIAHSAGNPYAEKNYLLKLEIDKLKEEIEKLKSIIATPTTQANVDLQLNNATPENLELNSIKG